jgi:hypothetical protein
VYLRGLVRSVRSVHLRGRSVRCTYVVGPFGALT